jgi:hypothetical protein
LFDHPDIDHINLLDMPLDEELFLIEEKWIPDYNDALSEMLCFKIHVFTKNILISCLGLEP